MTDPGRDSDQNNPDESDASHEHLEPAPFWRSSTFAVVATLIALIGVVWRCA